MINYKGKKTLVCVFFALMELSDENSSRRKVVNYFYQKALSNMFEWVLNTPLMILTF